MNNETQTHRFRNSEIPKSEFVVFITKPATILPESFGAGGRARPARYRLLENNSRTSKDSTRTLKLPLLGNIFRKLREVTNSYESYFRKLPNADG